MSAAISRDPSRVFASSSRLARFAHSPIHEDGVPLIVLLLLQDPRGGGGIALLVGGPERVRVLLGFVAKWVDFGSLGGGGGVGPGGYPEPERRASRRTELKVSSFLRERVQGVGNYSSCSSSGCAPVATRHSARFSIHSASYPSNWECPWSSSRRAEPASSRSAWGICCARRAKRGA